MAERKSAGGRNSGMNIDSKLVRELAELLNETGLTEIEVEDNDRKIRVARGGVVASAAPAQMVAAPAPTPAAAPSAANRSHSERPMPLAPPVTTTTLSVTCITCCSLSGAGLNEIRPLSCLVSLVETRLSQQQA